MGPKSQPKSKYPIGHCYVTNCQGYFKQSLQAHFQRRKLFPYRAKSVDNIPHRWYFCYEYWMVFFIHCLCLNHKPISISIVWVILCIYSTENELIGYQISIFNVIWNEQSNLSKITKTFWNFPCYTYKLQYTSYPTKTNISQTYSFWTKSIFLGMS